MNNTLITSAVVLLVVLSGALFLSAKPEDKATGALTSPAIMSPWFSVGGLEEWETKADLTTSTTTVCAIQAPAATSTLSGGGINLVVSSTTASTVTIAKATTAFATTTLIRSASVSAGAQGAVLAASTTISALEQTNRTFAPNEWLVFSMTGGIGTFSPTGNCSAIFQRLAY